MKRLLSIELQKIFLNRSSKILTILYFGSLALLVLISIIKFDFGPFKFEIATSGVFNFPLIWHFNTYIASILKFFLAVVVVSIMANEYSNGTLKQNLIDGLTKKEFVLSKFYVVILFSLISTLFVFIISLGLGLAYSAYDEMSIIFSDLNYLFAYFLKHVAFFSLCMFLAILIKRSAFALGFLFVLYIFEGIAHGIIGKFIFDDFDKAYKIVKFFPLESMSNLILEPFTRVNMVKSAGKMLGEEFGKDHSVQLVPVLIASLWIFIFVFLSYKLLRKRDL